MDMSGNGWMGMLLAARYEFRTDFFKRVLVLLRLFAMRCA